MNPTRTATIKDIKINALLYGPQGAGKTRMAATVNDCPEMSPGFFLNIEGGLLSVTYRGDVEYTDVRSVAEVEEIFWAVRKGIVDKDADSQFKDVKSIVIDSGSELQTLSLEGLAREGAKKKSTRDIDDVYLEDYGKSTREIARLFRWFRDLPVHFIVTALPQQIFPKGAENLPPIEIRPQFTQKLSNHVLGYMDMVWYLWMNPETGARQFLTRDKGVYRAKTRGSRFAEALGPQSDILDFAKLFPLLVEKEGNPA